MLKKKIEQIEIEFKFIAQECMQRQGQHLPPLQFAQGDHLGEEGKLDTINL